MMLTLKSLGSPPAGAHWSFGPDYMARISRADALKLGPVALPRIGYECDVRTHRPATWPDMPCILSLQNIGGHYYVASCHVPMARWPELFGVKVEGGTE